MTENSTLQTQLPHTHQIQQDNLQKLLRCQNSIPTYSRVKQSAKTGLLQRTSPPPLRTLTLAILVDFSDRHARGAEATWHNRFFGTTNSVQHYFREVSYYVEGVPGHDMYPAEESSGNTNDGIAGWYRITWGLEGTRYDEHPATVSQRENVADWEKSSRRINEQIAVAAIRAADADIDFSIFDADSDGYLSSDELHIVFVLAGYELTTRAGRDFSTWRHHASLGKYNNQIVDGVRIFEEQIPGSDIGGGFCLVGEINFLRRNETDPQIEFGLIAHELGHDLGLPDLYDLVDANGKSAGIGQWGLMAYGDHLGNRYGDIPAHLCAWSKTFLKWVEPIIQEENTFARQISRVEDTPEIFLLLLKGQNFPSQEYFLVENRQNVLYDRALPGSGHVVDADPLDLYDQDKGTGSLGTDKNPWYVGNKTDFRIFNQSAPDSRDYQGHDTSIEARNISESADYTAIAVASPYLFLVHSDDRGNGRGIYSITNIDQDYRVDAGGVNAIQTTVGYDASQNAYIAWSDTRDGNREIYLAHIDPSNQKAGPDLRITATPGNSEQPDINMDGSGNYYLVWQDNSDGDWDVWMTRGPTGFVPPGQSDLWISQAEGPASAIAGTRVDISATINLSGDPLASGTYVLVRVYASADDVFDENDILIGESTETQFLNTILEMFGSATETIPCTLPQQVGSYRYFAVVDPTDFHRESDETNNIFAGNRVTTTPPGKVWHVSTTGDNDNGTGSPDKPFASIQRGINQASHGDTVLVEPGVYFESINFLGKGIVVGSQFLRTEDRRFIEQTIIDASKETTDRSVVYIVTGESEQAELVGLTVQNGRGSYVAYPDHHGGGISIRRDAVAR